MGECWLGFLVRQMPKKNWDLNQVNGTLCPNTHSCRCHRQHVVGRPGVAVNPFSNGRTTTSIGLDEACLNKNLVPKSRSWKHMHSMQLRAISSLALPDQIARNCIECITWGGNCCGCPFNIAVVRRWTLGDITGPLKVVYNGPPPAPPCSYTWWVPALCAAQSRVPPLAGCKTSVSKRENASTHLGGSGSRALISVWREVDARAQPISGEEPKHTCEWWTCRACSTTQSAKVNPRRPMRPSERCCAPSLPTYASFLLAVCVLCLFLFVCVSPPPCRAEKFAADWAQLAYCVFHPACVTPPWSEPCLVCSML